MMKFDYAVIDPVTKAEQERRKAVREAAKKEKEPTGKKPDKKKKAEAIVDKHKDESI